MKIEIAESMLYSWLRHCKGCQIVQTNFKVSRFWQQYNESELETLYNRFQDDERFSVFRFTSGNRPQSFSTVLESTECDLLGLLFEGGRTKIFAYESAFHENGLNYQDTQKKVIHKFFRNYLMTKSFFPNSAIELTFISPRIGDTTLTQLNANINNLRDFFSENNCEVDLKIIANEEFKSSILIPLCNLTDNIADESELFIRAVKLWKMTEINPGRQNRIRRYNNLAPAQAQVNENLAELRPGFIVKTRLYDLLKSGNLSNEEVSNLQDAAYCRRTFGNLRYPVLKLTDAGRNDNHGRSRYYADDISIRNGHYFVINDWYDRNMNSLLQYLAEHNI